MSIRWACNVSKWEPTEKEFLFATSCIQIEEKERINKLVYKKDVKASLIGRLMIRKFLSDYTGLSYNSITLSRDANNKPIYNTADHESFKVSFNVSHHGCFTVLAGELTPTEIGVDVMKLEYTGGKTLSEFFRIMDKNFSVSEWKKIKKSDPTCHQKSIAMFCRNWALKESYVKAIGKGITMDLSKLSFNIKSELQINRITSDTCLNIDGVKQPWIFEESLIDPLHCVSVALKYEDYISSYTLCNSLFKIISPTKLLENAKPLLPEDYEYCKKYFGKAPL